ncbi:hypothetical protein Tco_1578946 [Tanacetum coccineum]
MTQRLTLKLEAWLCRYATLHAIYNLDLKKQIEEMLKGGKLSHLIKELKQNSGKEQPKSAKKGETFEKDKALVILMVQP